MTSFTIPTIETERLILRAPHEGDLDAQAAFFQSDRSAAFGGPSDRSDVWRALMRGAGHWVIRGYGMWYIEDKATGKTQWRHQRAFEFGTNNGDRKKAYGTPAIIKVGDQEQLIAPAAVATEALDPATGKLLWTARTGGMNASGRPLYGNGLIFINNGMGSLGAIPAAGGAEREAKWSTRRNIPKKGSLLLKGEHLYMVADNGVASCLVAATGEVLWSERLNAGEFAASPILCQDRIYCFSLTGKCVVLAASPKEFKVLARGEFEDGFMASPAVTGNALILRTKSAVYRVE